MQWEKMHVGILGFLFILATATLSVATLEQACAVQESVAVEPETPSLVLSQATIHSMDGKQPFVGTVVVEDGKIAAVGKEVEAPDNARVIDLTGYHLVPGLIESRGKLWLTSAALSETNSKAGLNVLDAIDPWSEDWQELAAQGITSVYVQPSSASFLGGYGAVLRVGPYQSLDEIVLKSEAAVQASIGLTGATSKDRAVQVESLVKQLDAAKKELEKQGEPKDSDSAESEDRKEAETSGSESGDEGDSDEDDEDDEEESSSPEGDETAATTDPSKLALGRVLKGEIPLHVQVKHSDALIRVLEVAKKYKLRLVLDGLDDIGSASSSLLESGLPLCVGPVAGSDDPANDDLPFEWLSELSGKGRLWSLSGFGSEARASRMLRIHADAAAKFGLTDEEVLSALTSNPARMLGISSQVGTIAVGKDADIAVFAGHPVEASSPARLVLSRGEVIYESEVAVAGATLVSADDVVEGLPEDLPSAYGIRSRKIWTEEGWASKLIWVKDGKIVSLVEPGDDSGEGPIFDLQDCLITPGLVVGSTVLGQSQAVTDDSGSDMTYLRAVDAIDPGNKSAKRFLQGGFLHAVVNPGTSITSSGSLGHLRLGALDYMAAPVVANQLVLNSSARNSDRFPASLNGQLELIRKLIDGKPLPSNLYVTSAIEAAIGAEKTALVDRVKTGELKVVIYADQDLEIRSALKLIKDYGLTAVLASKGRLGAWIPQLKEAGVSVLVPALNGTEYQTRLSELASVGNAGIPLAFQGESPSEVRSTATLLVSAGLKPDVALQSLTHTAAAMFSLSNVALSSDATADFVVWTGSPLEMSSQPVRVIVDGNTVSKK